MSHLASEETNNESQNQLESVNVPFDYTVPHVSILKASICQWLRWIITQRTAIARHLAGIHEATYRSMAGIHQCNLLDRNLLRRSCRRVDIQPIWSKGGNIRRPVSVGTALQAAAPNDSAFIVARLIVGASSGFLNNAAPLLLNEISYPTHRPVANALFMCGYYLGALIAA
ncbi:sugar transporter (hexose transporter) [Penicillium malachiteum]|uniref:Sugar transporter (Hexose transporter) n=1 Tax=Penicillium malachiteum TaxID=1324776 RepID=A0AAD6HQ89_9EURO|nr:sugar transporter (hexose transporter) [Penicillium malachiteum]